LNPARWIVKARVAGFCFSDHWFRMRGMPGLGPAAEVLFFASPKQRTQKKGEPESGPLRGALRCSQRAGSG